MGRHKRFRHRLMRVVCAIALLGTGVAAPASTASGADPTTPTLTIITAGPHADGSYVDVNGEGFTPGAYAVFLCDTHATNLDDGCGAYESDVRVPTEGRFTMSAALRAHLAMPGSHADVDCSVAGACEIAMFTMGSVTTLAASTPYQIDDGLPHAPGITASVATLAASRNPSGDVDVHGTISCAPSVYVELVISVGSGSLSPVERDQVHCEQSTPFATTIAADLVSGPGEMGVISIGAEIDVPDGTSTGQAVWVPGDGSGQPPTTTPIGAHYYLALGDSLVTGFAAPPGQGYVDDLAAAYRHEIPDLTVVNYGCNSEVSSGVIANGLCQFDGKSQLQAAEAFIASHPGQVALITIDIGGNDVVFCANGQTADVACLNAALTQLDTNMDTILTRLQAAAGPSVPIVGMNYFNPYLNQWLAGPSGQDFARLTTAALDLVNQHLAASFAAHHVPMADVASAFESDDFTTMVDSPWGHIPVNVARACAWLDIGCDPGQLFFGDDANAAGYRVIADAFLAVQPTLTPSADHPVPTTPAPTTPAQPTGTAPGPPTPPASQKTPVQATAARAVEGHPTYAG